MAIHAKLAGVCAAALLAAAPAFAQVQLGDLKASMNGLLNSGYSATSGNEGGIANHGFTFGGNGTLSGSYYSPSFLSFSSSLYLNQSRANSDYQSISSASGVNLDATIFGGSEYPGTMAYALAYNADGSYGVPGLANYVTRGTSNTFSINWSEHIPQMPTFTAGYQLGTSDYSVYGANQDGSNAFHSLNLHSSYKWEGFGLNASYTLGGNHSLVPQVFAGESAEETTSSGSGFGFDVGHRLPLQGSISGGYTRSTWSSNYVGNSNGETVNDSSINAFIRPAAKITVSGNAEYSDNLNGQLLEAIVGAGGSATSINSSESSSYLNMQGEATYTPTTDLQSSLFVQRRMQTFEGVNAASTSYGMAGSYILRRPRLGMLSSTASAALNTDSQNGDNSLSFSASESYNGDFHNWRLNGNFSYAQNAQTLLVTYTNSYFNYSGHVNRHWGRLILVAGASAGRSGITDEPDTESGNQNYFLSVSYSPWFSASGNYSRSHGQALATGAGLAPVPIPSPIVPSDLISLFGGDSYGFGFSSSPARKCTISASYGRSISNTASEGLTSNNGNSTFTSTMQYQVRQLYFNSGYSRLVQGFSQSGVPAQTVATYYAGISRWFNFF